MENNFAPTPKILDLRAYFGVKQPTVVQGTSSERKMKKRILFDDILMFIFCYSYIVEYTLTKSLYLIVSKKKKKKKKKKKISDWMKL